MAGLLDFLKTPEGQGLLAGGFGYLANANKKTPWNNIGRGGIAGLLGYSNALDRVEQDKQNDIDRQYKQKQLGMMDTQMGQIAAKQAEEQRKREALQAFRGTLNPNDQALFDAFPEQYVTTLPQLQKPKQTGPVSVPAGGSVYDPTTGTLLYHNAPKPPATQQVVQGPDGPYILGPGGIASPVRTDSGGQLGPKPTPAPKLPPSALRIQDDSVDVVGTAGTINNQLAKYARMLSSGGLELGPVENKKSEAMNYLGMSSQNSRNFAEFRSTLEKLRNDSLRLNKGVQTEGDAVRAWNELIANINDPDVVQAQIGRIQELNETAIKLHKNKVDLLRNDYGVSPYDWSRYEQPNTGGATGEWGAPERIGPLNSESDMRDSLGSLPNEPASQANIQALQDEIARTKDPRAKAVLTEELRKQQAALSHGADIASMARAELERRRKR